MFSKKGKLLAVAAMVLAVVMVVLVAKSGLMIKHTDEGETSLVEQSLSGDKNTVRIWYADDALTDYINSVAVDYSTENPDIRVIPELVSGKEYLENISKASVNGENMPDLYITANDILEKAHLAGLADPIRMSDGKELNMLFPETAIDSISYQGEQVGYPWYYECSALLYNKTYLNNWARSALEAEIRADMVENGEIQETSTTTASSSDDKNKTEEQKKKEKEEAEAAAKEAEEKLAAEIAAKVSDEDVQSYIETYFPTTIDGLLTFSDAYDAPEGVDTIFKWAVNDIFYNYFFIGGSINMGGQFGDDTEQIDIYNEAAIKGLQTYQDLNQFFSISTDDVSYDGVIQDFMDGNIVMTIATTDAVAKLKAAKDEGDIDFEYGFASLPDISDSIVSRSMSVTEVIAVNGYSKNKDIANDFATYLCTRDGQNLYERAGKVTALTDATFGDNNDYLSIFKTEYTRSIPLPKMLETSNYWTELEMLFATVWDGADANAGLKALSEKMMLQVTGEAYTEEPIVIEKEVEEEDEIIETDTLEETPQ